MLSKMLRENPNVPRKCDFFVSTRTLGISLRDFLVTGRIKLNI